MPFRKSYGGSILSRHKDTMWSTISFSRTISPPSFWQQIANFLVQRKPSTPNAHFFLIKDKIEKVDIEIQYEPTGVMWLDVLTKPKHGKAFRVFHGQLMNVPEDYDDKIEHLNTHPDLLPPPDNRKKLLKRDRAVLVKALKP